MGFLSVDFDPDVDGSCGGGSMVVDTPDMDMMDVSPRAVSVDGTGQDRRSARQVDVE